MLLTLLFSIRLPSFILSRKHYVVKDTCWTYSESKSLAMLFFISPMISIPGAAHARPKDHEWEFALV